ncbi:hypothetical protein DFA_10575 [Cavenderia fasciculata]|uniref:Profilin n=1 Tax=Cavenderia fasciculata TaxID=261658 RepID=F4QAL4_CACFS|nr:uncharacterized protein DFA_10575 [Cavenderia fasciculata]EGG15733.1 hypothetical protein DFA_10575 [Cavenderia fasciculata]|eukprot:XP_004354475.1 hypothetical protein DFA_10575 [Cavenderia fasciculata]
MTPIKVEEMSLTKKTINEQLIKDFLGNELFQSVLILGLDGKVYAYNKSPEPGEIDQIVKGFKSIKKMESFSLIGEKFIICIKDEKPTSKVYAQNDRLGCIVIQSKKAFIIGMFPKKLEVHPRICYLDNYCKQFDAQDYSYLNNQNIKIVM